jgi:hypothetical protein
LVDSISIGWSGAGCVTAQFRSAHITRFGGARVVYLRRIFAPERQRAVFLMALESKFLARSGKPSPRRRRRVECSFMEEFMFHSLVADRPPDNPADRADYVGCIAFERWLGDGRAVRGSREQRRDAYRLAQEAAARLYRTGITEAEWIAETVAALEARFQCR